MLNKKSATKKHDFHRAFVRPIFNITAHAWQSLRLRYLVVVHHIKSKHNSHSRFAWPHGGQPQNHRFIYYSTLYVLKSQLQYGYFGHSYSNGASIDVKIG